MVSALLAIYWDTDCVFSFVIEMNSMWSQLMIFCLGKLVFFFYLKCISNPQFKRKG